MVWQLEQLLVVQQQRRLQTMIDGDAAAPPMVLLRLGVWHMSFHAMKPPKIDLHATGKLRIDFGPLPHFDL
jgi:hypothetical protein